MRYVVVIPDGMGDFPVKKLGSRTPLEAARTPNMDFFASHGTVGLTRNIPKGFVPGTDIGCMSVFGYDPRKFFTGRGPLEAAELGIKLKKNELAFRCNLITTQGPLLKDFCADRVTTKEAKILLDFLNRKLDPYFRKRVKFFSGRVVGYRNLMIYRRDGGSMRHVACSPPHDIMGREYKRFYPKGREAGFLIKLMEVSRALFKDHPVNKKRARRSQGQVSMVWLWGQGTPPRLLSYCKKYGVCGDVITAVDLVKGIAIHAGLGVINVPGATGYFDTNYIGKARYALKALKKDDLVFVHLESTDEAGHRGNARLKIKAIEDIDRLVLGTLRKGLKELGAYKIMVLPDHYTSVETRAHADPPVPFLIYSSEDEKKGPKKFCEKTAKASKVYVSEGHTLMGTFIGPRPKGTR